MATATMERPKNKTKKTKMKFRVLHGLHVEGRQKDTTQLNVLTEQLEEGMITQAEFDAKTKGLTPRRVFHPGELFESKRNMLELNGPHPMTPKFARAEDDVAAMVPVPYQPPDTKMPVVEDTLSSMTLDQLRKYARAEEIDIRGLNTAEEIAQRLRDVAAEMDG